MAQEIQRQLEELDVKQRELENRGVELEKVIRGENIGTLHILVLVKQIQYGMFSKLSSCI